MYGMKFLKQQSQYLDDPRKNNNIKLLKMPCKLN